ncbi:hypothetical protein [Luteipulveratus mongoliensis]|uniref:Uncharacterized protein n=1 Tax=Luteipulveratus mongoliensis TaxID=571913 RepID=A0A0K1JK36_9MICO|nr:hypothetical protein [Luteipulveratus mongoliensis]AKU17082.1 hypothetical protein VV02_16435 [Luteipulveratus mongoliensis]
MISLREQLIDRLKDATARLDDAHGRDDEYDTMLVSGEIDSLLRIADDHGLHLPQAEDYRKRRCRA